MVTMTAHAEHRAAEMGVELDCIEQILRDADVDYPQSDRGEGHRLAQLGDLAVAYVATDKGPVVVTVLLRKVEQWAR